MMILFRLSPVIVIIICGSLSSLLVTVNVPLIMQASMNFCIILFSRLYLIFQLLLPRCTHFMSPARLIMWRCDKPWYTDIMQTECIFRYNYCATFIPETGSSIADRITLIIGQLLSLTWNEILLRGKEKVWNIFAIQMQHATYLFL